MEPCWPVVRFQHSHPISAGNIFDIRFSNLRSARLRTSNRFRWRVRTSSGVPMKAVLCSQYCGPDDLVLTEVPDPSAAPGEAVIAIKAAALTFFDALMIQGKYQIKPPFPFSPSAEVAGVVESVGAGVTELKPGDRVMASCGHNGAREKIALPASAIVKIPDRLDFDRAAGITIIYGTAMHALEDRA